MIEREWRGKIWFPAANHLIEALEDHDPSWRSKFNSQYIGGRRGNRTFNSLAIRSALSRFSLELKLERSDAVRKALEELGLQHCYREDGIYEGDCRRHYFVVVPAEANQDQLDGLVGWIIKAHQRYDTLKPAA